MQNFTWILTLIVFLSTQNLFSQHDHSGCGTPPGKSEWLQEYQKNTPLFPRSEEMLIVPITMHLVGEDNGAGRMGWQTAFRSFCALNDVFRESNIRFFLNFVDGEPVNNINNSNFFDHSSFQPGRQMAQQNNINGTINSYFVENPAGNCGYYNGLAVVNALNCSDPTDLTWAHEIGHYLSLPHTFSGWEGIEGHRRTEPAPETLANGALVEKVDGSNCSFAADGFCDTSPDYINGRWTCGNNSESIFTQMDPNGEVFRSDGALIMSYSNDQCANRFSPEQIQAMRANLEFNRPNHIFQGDTLGDLPNDFAIEPIFPESSERLTYYEGIMLEWLAMPNATHYHLIVSKTPTFGAIVFKGFIEDSSIDLTGLLEPDTRYYWKVFPFNAFDVCQDYSSRFSFRTGEDETTAVKEIEGVENLTIAPNPAVEKQEIRLTFNSIKAFDYQIQILNTTGENIFSDILSGRLGRNVVTLNSENLIPGLYLIQMINDEGRLSKKLIIQ